MIGFSAGLPNQGILSKMPNMGGAIPLRSEAPAEYQSNGATVRRRGFERHPVVQACVRVITDLFSTIPYQAYRKIGSAADEIELLSEDHPASRILEHPSPMFSAQRFRALTSVHYLIYGNALWFFERPNMVQGEVISAGRPVRDPAPVSLRLIQPEDLLTVYVNQKAYPLWYWWRDVLGYPHVSPVTDIMHFRDLNAKGIVFGYPRAAAALNEIIGDDEASQHVRQIVTNSGMPPAFALAEEYLDPAKALEMENILYEKWISRGERGRFSFIGGVKDVKTVGFNLNDLEFPELRQISREGICFAPGTLIHTDRGMVAIDKVVSGDRVLTHLGRYRTVRQTMVREHKGEMRRIAAKGLAPVLCTPNHPWLADYAKPFGQENKRRRTGEPQWLAAEELQPRQTLPASPRHYRRGGNHRLTMPHMAVDGARVDLLRWYDRPVDVDGARIRPQNPHGTWLPRFLTLDEDLGWLFGLYLAEGSVGHNSAKWYLNVNETDIASRVMGILRGMGVEGADVPGPTGSTRAVSAHSNILRTFFAQCGADSASKFIPEWAMSAPPAFRRGMIDGYAAGDGSQDRGSTRVTTVSTSLAAQLRMLLWTEQRHGALTTRPAGTWAIQGRSGESLPSFSVGWRDEPKKRGSIGHEDGYSAFPLMQNSAEPYDGLVYNLSVDEDESYVTEGGTVHNCSAFGVDPRMIGIGSATKDAGLSGVQFKEARVRLIQSTIEPMLNSFVSELNMWLAPEFGADVYYRYDPDIYAKLVEDHDATSVRVERELKSGLRTLEEAREAIDLEPTMDPTHMLAIGPVQFVPVASAMAGTQPPGMPPGMGGPPGMLPPGALPPNGGDPMLAPPGDGPAALPPGGTPPQLGAGQPAPSALESMSAGPSLASTIGRDPNSPDVPMINDGSRDPEDKRVLAEAGAGGIQGQPPVAGSPTDIAAANAAETGSPEALTGPISTPAVPPVSAAEWQRIGELLKIVPMANGRPTQRPRPMPAPVAGQQARSAVRADFDESEHPRAEDGKFTAGAGGVATADDDHSPDPGKKKGSADVGDVPRPRAFAAAVSKQEDAIRDQSHETAHVWSRNGKHVLEVQGDSRHVLFTDDQFALLRDAVITHNHPNGASFSDADVQLATLADAAEIRVVGRDGTFVMVRPENGWPKWGDRKEPGSLAHAASREWARMGREVRKGRLPMFGRTVHAQWKAVAPQFGIHYVRLSDRQPTLPFDFDGDPADFFDAAS